MDGVDPELLSILDKWQVQMDIFGTHSQISSSASPEELADSVIHVCCCHFTIDFPVVIMAWQLSLFFLGGAGEATPFKQECQERESVGAEQDKKERVQKFSSTCLQKTHHVKFRL